MHAVEEQFNAAASVGTGWGISLKNGRVTESGQGSVLERSQVYVAALSRLFSMNSRVTGHRFLQRELQGLYKLMPWEEREIGDEHLFRRLDVMAGVQRAFAVTRGGHLNLLRFAPLFAGLGEEELQAISDALKLETHPKGRDIVSRGEPGATFYIIESGSVEVWIRHEDGTETLEALLGRGDYFGGRALLSDAHEPLPAGPRAVRVCCRWTRRTSIGWWPGDSAWPRTWTKPWVGQSCWGRCRYFRS